MTRLRGGSRYGVVAAMFLLLVSARPAMAADPKPPDIQALTQDIQKIRKEAESLTLALWLPPQYWKATLAGNAQVSEAAKDKIVETIRPYVIIAVADAKVGLLGTMTFTPEADIREKARLVDAKGNAYEPLAEADIQPAARGMLRMMKPIWAANMGAIGQNMQVLVFPATDKAGAQIADATAKGSLVLKFDGNEYRWKLPLGSLLPPKFCPDCKEKCSGAWDFCPYCGKRLESASPADAK
jgi:hypothetical protein